MAANTSRAPGIAPGCAYILNKQSCPFRDRANSAMARSQFRFERLLWDLVAGEVLALRLRIVLEKLILPGSMSGQESCDLGADRLQFSKHRRSELLCVTDPRKFVMESFAKSSHLFVLCLKLVDQGRSLGHAVADEQEHPLFFIVKVGQQLGLEELRCTAE
jgi:hypothetical protein